MSSQNRPARRKKVSKFNAVNNNIQNPKKFLTDVETDTDESQFPEKYYKCTINPLKTKNALVGDLLANLSVSLAAKEKLLHANAELRETVSKLKKENANLVKVIKENKEMYDDSIKNLQMEVANNERSIIDRSKYILVRQKRYVDNVIAKLNYENKVLKRNINNMETQFTQKLKEVEDKLKE